MADNLENIKVIVDDVLGDPKRDYCGSGGWYEYNCPCCADEHHGPDGKYNFAVNIEQLYGHCWKCGYHGKLSKVIKTYGSQSDVEEYRDELTALKESRYFTLSGLSSDSIDDLFNDQDLELPKGFKLIDKDDYYCRNAYQYLVNRGVDDRIIKEFNIGYIGANSGKFSNRIVIPSYDAYGDLNYWVARDYTDKAYRKVLNPEVDKKKITFNESHVNWYEPITIVEGPFDHIVVPNSIPLLGKMIDDECDVYKKLIEKAHSYINILLDDDATETAYKMYKQLNNIMPGQIRVIECPDGYDASDYYNKYGAKGILSLLKSSHKIDEFTLATL